MESHSAKLIMLDCQPLLDAFSDDFGESSLSRLIDIL